MLNPCRVYHMEIYICTQFALPPLIAQLTSTHWLKYVSGPHLLLSTLGTITPVVFFQDGDDGKVVFLLYSFSCMCHSVRPSVLDFFLARRPYICPCKFYFGGILFITCIRPYRIKKKNNAHLKDKSPVLEVINRTRDIDRFLRRTSVDCS